MLNITPSKTSVTNEIKYAPEYILYNQLGAYKVCNRDECVTLLKKGGWFDRTDYRKYRGLEKSIVLFNKNGVSMTCLESEAYEFIKSGSWTKQVELLLEETNDEKTNEREKPEHELQIHREKNVQRNKSKRASIRHG